MESKIKQIELVKQSLEDDGRKLTEANTKLEGKLTSAMQEIEVHLVSLIPELSSFRESSWTHYVYVNINSNVSRG